MELSGTVHLNENSNDRFQFIYGSLHDDTFFGLYARFKMKSNHIKEIDFKLINYNNNSKLGLKNVVLESNNLREGDDLGSEDSRFISFKCFTLIVSVAILKDDEVAFGKLPNLNLEIGDQTFLEVLREENKTNLLADCKDSFFSSGERVIKNVAPGGICPRGYSKLILS